MKVLVIQNKMIGDVLASTVICEAIKLQNPDWEVHYMIQPNTFAVVENNPFIDKIIFFEPEKHKGFRKLVVYGLSLKIENYDAVIDAYGKWQSVFPSYFSGARIRIGFKKWYTSLLFTKTVIPEKNVEVSAIYHRLQLAEELVSESKKDIFPKIYLTDNELKLAKESVANRLNTTIPIIMISVLGSDSKKSLPAKYMAEVLDSIANEKDVQLLFNFMPNQESEAKAIYDLCQPETKSKIILDFYTKGLRTFLAILSQCDALIGNEGGAVNMAKALNIKTFTIFSPWINKSSWNMKNDEINHVSIHLNDYFPEIYNGKHPKKFKNQSLELYLRLAPNLFKEKLAKFVASFT
jgi:heptosyltransferase-2